MVYQVYVCLNIIHELCCGFNVPPTAKVMASVYSLIRQTGESPGSNLRPLVYRASDITTAPRVLLLSFVGHSQTVYPKI